MRRLLFAVLPLFSFAALAATDDFDDEYEKKPWQELAVRLPAAPEPVAQIPFYVSAATDNLFTIDRKSLSVDTDGVVRYVLTITTAGGARNVTYEGMRCETREQRIYASGRMDGSWSKSRNNEWARIKDVIANRHHAALFLEYFCPGGVIVANTAEALDALQRGVHPLNKRW